jgi:ribonuclease E
LRNALRLDRARIQIGRISRFGLLEMSRQRLRPSLSEAARAICPRCNGQGTIRGIESLALAIIRIIEEEASRPNTAQIQAQVPVDVATYIVNEKREALSAIEQKHRVTIIVIPNPHLDSPNYKVKRIREDEVGSSGRSPASYKLLETPEAEVVLKKSAGEKTLEEPAVKTTFPSEPVPVPKKESAIKRFLSSMFGNPPTPTSEEKEEPKVEDLKQSEELTTTEPTPKEPTYQGPRRHPRHRDEPKRSRRGSRGGRRRYYGGQNRGGRYQTRSPQESESHKKEEFKSTPEDFSSTKKKNLLEEYQEYVESIDKGSSHEVKTESQTKETEDSKKS